MDDVQAVGTGRIIEFQLNWPMTSAAMPGMAMTDAVMPGMATDAFSCCAPGGGSTHELVLDPGGTAFWVSGQKYDHLARIALDGSALYYPMPTGSGPHGSVFDAEGRLWVTFESAGALARIDTDDGRIVETIDVTIASDRLRGPMNPHPHGLTLGADGALWFTGKLSNTIGRVDRGGRVEHFVLPSIGAVPIYVAPGPDGAIWCTELGASRIARVASDGTVTEIEIPTANSRPITIKPDPLGRAMWFTQEAGGRLGRIDLADPTQLTEYPVPLPHRDAILAGHTFDADGNLWVQQYVSPPAAGPTVDDYVVRFDKAILEAPAGDLTGVGITWFKAPSQRTVMHRITMGPAGSVWFSELGLDKVGRIDRSGSPPLK
ncbi:hypothetical protein ASE86_14525 [Sphingomonas sp. Leaf33]|uniref:Vgb family protein n=1 Tax=Sphingomonas sp. Leaf33 TaxID=1736215 RepID=UPI0006F5BCFA|nr:hypothetical protein [Sphingomonas sp. Leaf33]KQN21437.1 hypothetical protein ASE86_14525 [Sphingomonas sp. Leaf33]